MNTNIYINLKTFPNQYLEDIITQYYTKGLYFIYNDEDSLKCVLEIYKKLKIKSNIHLVCNDSKINLFLYNLQEDLNINHGLIILPKTSQVYNNIEKVIKERKLTSIMLSARVFNLDSEYNDLKEYLSKNKAPYYSVYALTDDGVSNYKQFLDYAKANNIFLTRPMKIYGNLQTFEAVIIDDSIFYKNIVTKMLYKTPIYILDGEEQYIPYKIPDYNIDMYIQNKESYINIYNKLYQLFFNSKILK